MMRSVDTSRRRHRMGRGPSARYRPAGRGGMLHVQPPGARNFRRRPRSRIAKQFSLFYRSALHLRRWNGRGKSRKLCAMRNPYLNLPPEAFWRTGVADVSPLAPREIYKKKWTIEPTDRIATAGSCFAQHVTDRLRRAGFNVLDLEPPPEGLPDALCRQYGYRMYSARYGNIYTSRQLLQLAQEALGLRQAASLVWKSERGFHDGLRPTVEPNGLRTPDEVLMHRRFHLERVRTMLLEMDVFVFTLGLTETWEHESDGTVYPTAPGVAAGEEHYESVRFRNLDYDEVRADLEAFMELVWRLQAENGKERPCRFLLTVSPVPLTATRSGHHVLVATTYSKSVLRAVAGHLAATHEEVDYFPSYELITSSWSRGLFFDSNLRTVSPAGVDLVMSIFMSAHALGTRVRGKRRRPSANDADADDEAICDEVILESFART